MISVNLCLQACMSWHTCTGPVFIFFTAIFNHLRCLLHLQQTREVVMVVTNAPDKQAHTNQQSRWKRTSAVCRYLTQGLFLCWYATLHKLFLCKFYPSIQLFFSAYWFRKGLYFDQTLCHNFFSDIIRSVYPVIYHFIFLKKCFSQSSNFYENKLIWYYGTIRSQQKWSGKCMVYGLMDTIPRIKTKTLPLWKIRVCYFFRAVYHSKNHVIPHPVYCCHIGRHLKYFATLQNNNNMPVKFSKYNQKLSENSY